MEKLTQKLIEYLSGKPNYEKFTILHGEMGYDFNFIKNYTLTILKRFLI